MGVDISKRIQRGGRAAQRRLSQGFLSTPGISMPHRLGHSAVFSQSAGVDVQMAISSLLCPPEEGGETSDTGTNPPALISAFLPEFPLHKSPIEDHHQVLGLIAKGSLGPILKLKDISKDKIYAVKVLSKSEILKQKLLEQSKGEVIIQRQLKHPFIHKLHRCWQTRHHVFIMCDYCSAGDLYTYWLLRGRFQEAEVRLFAAEMGGALGFLQDLGIMHRDIKMENILISDRGHLRLSDFGLSRRLVRGGRAFTICGTIPYMAPEVLSGGPYNHAADWWSLGILLFTLVAGEFPLAAEPDHRRMWRKARDFPYAIPKTFSSALALLLTDVSKLFYAKTQRTAFDTWSLSRCGPSSVAPHLTLTSFRKRRWTSSSSSGSTLTGRLNQGEEPRSTRFLSLTVNVSSPPS
ncbi:ribosomal protein S6 kinase-related protein-like isoform 2-T2 [Menidia menidia]